MRALLMIVAATMMGCSEALYRDKAAPEIPYPLPKFNAEPEYFKTCQEIKDWAHDRNSKYQQLMAAYQAWSNDGSGAVSASAASGASPSYTSNGTNIQEPGIDEPDIVKTNSRFVFAVREGFVEILSLKDQRVVQTLNFPQSYALQLLLSQDQLVVLSSETRKFSVHIFNYDGQFYKGQTHEFPGWLRTARLADRDLLIVGQDQVAILPELDEVNGTINGVPCTAVQKPQMYDFNFDLLGLYRIDMNSPKNVQSTSRLGRADQIYVSKNHIYTIGYGFGWFFWDPRLSDDDLMNSQILNKYSWREDCGPRFLAGGRISGHTHNVFAFYERQSDKRLFVTTTIWNLGHKISAVEQNHHELQVTKTSEYFSPTESVRSVRYLDNKAYVVTFRQIDPLHVFDLDSLKQQSELQVPGFSTYLHPINSVLLMGVGHGANNEMQISLFDKSDPTNVKILSQKIFGERAIVYADSDHHAFTYDPATGTAAIPVTLFHKNWTFDLSGAMMFRPLVNLEPVARLSHSSYTPVKCQKSSYGRNLDIQRVVRVGQRWVSVSPFAIQLHDEQTLAPVKSIGVPGAEQICDKLNPPLAYCGGGL